MKTIIIIPARGNSKRIPEKNVLVFNNEPLIAHSIKYAKQNSEISTDVYVTTDNDKIKEVALNYGANVIDRPNEISGDHSTTVSALKHVLQTIEVKYDVVVLLQPTNPLRPKDLLSKAYKSFIASKSDSLMSVSKNDKKLGRIVNGYFQPYTYKMGQRSQDIEPLYFENGLLYITKSELIMTDDILGKVNVPYIVEHPYATVDIDTVEDLKYAEFIVKNYPDE